jgi:hypothetical protein
MPALRALFASSRLFAKGQKLDPQINADERGNPKPRPNFEIMHRSARMTACGFASTAFICV